MKSLRHPVALLLLSLLFSFLLLAAPSFGRGLTPEDVARIKSVAEAALSPSGQQVAYVLTTPPVPFEDDDGKSWAELWVADVGGETRPWVSGEVRVSKVAWSRAGDAIFFLTKKASDEHRGVYRIPASGGEATKVASHDGDIKAFSVAPDGATLAFVAKEPVPKEETRLVDLGFDAKVYEEGLRHDRLYLLDLGDAEAEPAAVALDGSVSEFHFGPKGERLALALAPTPFIDDHYMERRVRVVDLAGVTLAKVENPGKLGAIRWSPDGAHLALISAADHNDPKEGRLMVASATDGGVPRDVLPDLMGHVESIAWQDEDTIMYVAAVGTLREFGKVDVDGQKHRVIAPPALPILSKLSLAASGAFGSFVADSPDHPAEVYVMKHGEQVPTRLTNSNPWLAEIELAPQEVVRYEARDGVEVEGVLIRPLDGAERAPLIVVVHGGPESHYPNGWRTAYSQPGQLGAARGYAVFAPNYRGSTGRGVAYSKMSQADYAEEEFNDIVDGVEHLVEIGVADRDRVGITGGSYGGYASAWGATALSEHYAASVMFVGISDQIAKVGTTDIPKEMFAVHARRWPWEHWDWFRERSPIHHIQNHHTPILIMHGEDDPRVHPAQSLELYRYLKLIDQAAARLVLYPKEQHGNKKAAARYDYSLRMLRWFDHYLKSDGDGPTRRKLSPPPHRLDYPLDPGADGED